MVDKQRNTNKGSITLLNSYGVKTVGFDSAPQDIYDWFMLGDLDAGNGSAELKTLWKMVPWLYRGITVISDKVAAMPFEIDSYSDAGGVGDQVDTSEEWKNVVGIIPNPYILLWMLEASKTLDGNAYLFRPRVQGNVAGINFDVQKELHYILPGGCVYVPAKYKIPIVTMELRNAKLGPGLRSALLVGAG